MHRLLVTPDELTSASPHLTEDAARHLKVLRPKNNEQIELFDGIGRTRSCRYQDGILLPCEAPVRHPRVSRALALFACVTKGSRWDWTIEKATELGVTRIIPVISDRTIVRIAATDRAAKRERWQRIAEDAARQSDAVYLPEICEAVDFDEALRLVRQTTCFIGALVNPPAPPLLTAIERIDATAEKSIAIFIGPEGDFTPNELAALVEVAQPTSFGPTILRAETAAVYAVSVVAAALQKM